MQFDLQLSWKAWKAGIASLVLASSVGCADDLLGEKPPLDQLYYPVGLAVTPGDARLLVVNSNFDLRYGSGSVMSLPIAETYALAAQAKIDAPVTRLPDGTSGVRIPSFGGEVAVASGNGKTLAVVAVRGMNEVAAVEVGSDGALNCATEGSELIDGLDCTPAYLGQTDGNDPFSAASLGDKVVVGHLDATLTGRRPFSLFDLEKFEARRSAESSGLELPESVVTATAAGFPGVSSLAGGADGRVIAASRPLGSLVELASYEVVDDQLVRKALLAFGSLTGASDVRGVTRSQDGSRVFVTFRVLQSSNATSASPAIYSGGVAVVRVRESSLEIQSMLSIGEELGRPALLERGEQKFLYVPDVRNSEVYVLDARTDSLAVGAVIGGYRQLDRPDEDPLPVRWLDAPAAVAFANLPAENKTLAFVSNFGNSTLAVIDATSDSALEHHLVGRIGRVLYPDGSTEE